MEKHSKIPMIYGYAVCLVTVITVIISVASFVNAVIDLGDPLYAERDYNTNAPSLASFDNYKMDIYSSSDKEQAFTPDDATLRAMYEAAKADKIHSVKHRSNRTMVVNGLLMILCVVFFTFHWRWMRKLSKSEA